MNFEQLTDDELRDGLRDTSYQLSHNNPIGLARLWLEEMLRDLNAENQRRKVDSVEDDEFPEWDALPEKTCDKYAPHPNHAWYSTFGGAAWYCKGE